MDLRADRVDEDSQTFRDLVDGMALGVLVQRDGQALYANAAFSNLLGYASTDEILHLPDVRLLFHPADRTRLNSAGVPAGGQGGERTAGIVVRATRANDAEVWLTLHAQHSLWNGAPAQSWVCEDITEARELARTLRSEADQLRELIDDAADGVILFDEENRIVSANARLCAITGYAEQELIGQEGDILLPPEHRESKPNRLKEVRDKQLLSSERWLQRKDGSRFYVEISSSRLGDGRVQSLLRDVTARREVEEERAKLAAAVEQAGDIVFITSAGGIIQYVNPAFERITGYSSQEAVGQTPRLLKSGQKEVFFYHAMWETISHGGVWRGNYTNQRKDGSHYQVDAVHSPIKNELGEITHYIAVHHDISDRISLEEQLRQSQKMEAVGQLAGGVAHEFNNLLQVIKGYADLVLRGMGGDEKNIRNMGRIQTAVDKASVLTGHLLAYTRKQNLQMAPTDLNALVQQLDAMLRPLLGAGIKVNLSLHPDLPILNIDRAMIEQVLMNLCLNARDAMPEGGTLLIRTHIQNAPRRGLEAEAHVGPYVALSVTDTGTGMNESVRSQVFDPFFTTKPPGQGTGLGLSMVQGIIEQHRGLVDVYSEEGRGTTFTLYLPSKQATQPHSAGAQGAAVDDRPTVLVAEDDTAVLGLLASVLDEEGYRVLTAEDGGEAMRLARSHGEEIDLAVLDLVMPKYGGREVYEVLRGFSEHMPVIFCSGYGVTLPEEILSRDPFTRMFKKPYAFGEFLKEIGTLLQASKSDRP